MADVGLTFSPTSVNSQQQRTGQGSSPVQDAIRILSFRLPTVLGASAATPMQNLGGPSPFGSQLGAAVIQNWLKQLLGGMGPSESSYGQMFGDTGMAAPPPALPASVIINQPHPPSGFPTGGSGGGMPSSEPMPSPFPGQSGGIGGGGQPY